MEKIRANVVAIVEEHELCDICLEETLWSYYLIEGQLSDA